MVESFCCKEQLPNSDVTLRGVAQSVCLAKYLAGVDKLSYMWRLVWLEKDNQFKFGNHSADRSDNFVQISAAVCPAYTHAHTHTYSHTDTNVHAYSHTIANQHAD